MYTVIFTHAHLYIHYIHYTNIKSNTLEHVRLGDGHAVNRGAHQRRLRGHHGRHHRLGARLLDPLVVVAPAKKGNMFR